jgi:glycosyltransferase involved in cell wall biosynthesis
VEALEFSSRLRPSDWTDVRRLREILRRDAIEVVHCHRGKDHWTAAVALRGFRPRPALIRTRHVVTPMRTQLTNRWLMRRATDGVIAVSEAARASVARLFPDDLNRVKVIYSAVDLELFRASRRSERHRREVLGAGADECVVGLIGRVQRIKGQRVLLEAAASLKSRGTVPRIVMAGTERTPRRIDRLRAEANALGVESNTIFFGEVDDIATLIASLDVCVIASLGSEGSSRVALEAMASGVPVIASRVGVLPEIIKPGENGLLFAPGDSEELAHAMASLLGDSAKRAQLGEAGRRTVERDHRPDDWIAKTRAVYDAAAAQGGSLTHHTHRRGK